MINSRNTKKTDVVLHIFGGGELVAIAEKIALDSKWKVVVRTGKRFENSLPPLDSSTKVFIGDDLNRLMNKGGKPKLGDYGISFSAPWVFSQDVIDMFSGDIFNLHNQSLPKFRGAAGMSWLIMMNELKGGCCIHRLISKVDAGTIYARSDFDFSGECKYPKDYDDYLSKYSKNLLQSWLPNLLITGETGPEIVVDETSSEYWPRLNTDIQGWIDWSWNIQDIELFCNAFSFPHDGAQTMARGIIVRLKNVEAITNPRKYHPFQRGLIFRIGSNGELFVAHPDGILKIKDFIIQNKDTKLRLGDRLFTPNKNLCQAMTRRVQYLPSGEIIDH